MGRHWTLSGQLLALQLVIVSVVLVAVAAVSLAQTSASFKETAGRRAGAVAESVAASVPLRSALELRRAGRGGTDDLVLVRSVAESARSVSGSTSVAVLDADGTVLASAVGTELGRTLRLPGDVLRLGRGHTGDASLDGQPTVVAQVPVLSDDRGQVGEVLGLVAVTRERPTLRQDLTAAAPNLLVYLGVASALGVLGSLLVARRVKRQTLGLEPLEITGLVEQREAVLHGVKEGVLALDLAGTVTLANDMARRLLHLPHDAVGRSVAALDLPAGVQALLTEDAVGTDVPLPVRDRMLVLNHRPIRSHGRPIGSVTTLRDRTELLRLQRELDAVSDVTQTLRAQAHEFSNRLHTISGLIELGEYGEVVGYVERIGRHDDRLTEHVTSRIADAAVAALLVAKSSLADERGVALEIAPACRLGVLDDALSTDVATVLGNLVDNAVDAAAGSARDGGAWVRVEVVQDEEAVVVTVTDGGPGIPDGVADVFTRGVTTKDSPADHGIGLSLVRLLCTRRGGTVEVSQEGGTVFRARLPLRAPVALP